MPRKASLSDSYTSDRSCFSSLDFCCKFAAEMNTDNLLGISNFTSCSMDINLEYVSIIFSIGSIERFNHQHQATQTIYIYIIVKIKAVITLIKLYRLIFDAIIFVNIILFFDSFISFIINS